MNKRFEAMQANIDKRFEQVDRRFDERLRRHDRQFLWLVGLIVTCAGLVVAGVRLL